jgi:hypothetical protein
MKKVIFLSLYSTVFCSLACIGQTTLKINDLNMPTSPAFVIMGKSPANIEKPANPKALAVSLINLWEGNGAAEFAPYWFKDRPAYTFEENLEKKAPVFQTLGISAATSKKDSITNIAVGLRTQVVRIYSQALKKDILSLKDSIVNMLSEEDPEQIDLAGVAAARKRLLNLQGKPSFNFELAGAYMGKSSNVSSLASTKAGAWAHLRWTPYKFPLDLIVLSRYSWALNANPKSNTDSAFLDYGLSLSYQDKDKNFELQVEYVNRRDLSLESNFDRFALVANYQIIPGIVAVASIGKDFDKVNNIFALFGLKFGISKEVAKLN